MRMMRVLVAHALSNDASKRCDNGDHQKIALEFAGISRLNAERKQNAPTTAEDSVSNAMNDGFVSTPLRCVFAFNLT